MGIKSWILEHPYRTIFIIISIIFVIIAAIPLIPTVVLIIIMLLAWGMIVREQIENKIADFTNMGVYFGELLA
jgi:hypothetical protein